MFFENEITQPQFPWNTLFRSMGILIGAVLFAWQCRRARLKLHWWQALAFFAFFWMGGLFGARLLCGFEWALSTELPVDWSGLMRSATAGGMRWYGSMLLFVVFLPLVTKLAGGQQRWRVFDIYALSICAFIISVKQGCQFAGDGCYGVPTTLPWGMYYSHGLKPSLLPVHPTPVYDSLFHLALLFFLCWWRKKAAFAGQTGLLFFMASSAFCFFLEFIRVNPEAAWGMTLAQWTYLAVCMAAGALYWYLHPAAFTQKTKPALKAIG